MQEEDLGGHGASNLLVRISHALLFGRPWLTIINGLMVVGNTEPSA
jgi:hypothetical protein